MKHISTYNITKDDWTFHTSKLCSVACSLGYINQFSELDGKINELVQSFFNQWQFVIDSYDKLCKLLNILNRYSDTRNEGHILSEYIIESSYCDIDFKSYSYLLIVSIKTYLDLFACLIDIIQNPTIKKGKYTDFYNLGKKKENNIIIEILDEFKILKDRDKYSWIAKIKEIRDAIIHRGYQLKPIFEVTKSEELNIRAYKGTDMYYDVINIEIGKLFHDFMSDMPIIEERISNILINNTPVLNGKLLVNASFRYGGGINEYKYQEIEPPN